MEKKKKIMVIDDEEDFLNLVKLNLEETHKYEIFILSSAKDIVSQVNSFKPDLILLDLLMPEVLGLDACKMLNKASVGKDIPIIVLSALEKESDKRAAYKAGVIDYLVKPVTIDALLAKIEKTLISK